MRNQTINALRLSATSLSLGFAAVTFSAQAANLTATLDAQHSHVVMSGLPSTVLACHDP